MEIPAFNRLEQKYSRRGIKRSLAWLSSRDGPGTYGNLPDSTRCNTPILVGNDDTVSDFEIISFPATYVIAPGWKLHKKSPGHVCQQSCRY